MSAEPGPTGPVPDNWPFGKARAGERLSEGGKKFDSGKLRMDLIPVNPLRELARVYTFGAGKYDDRNWEKGIAYSRLYAAMLRHVTSWWMGEDHDADSSCHHLASVAWAAFALMEYGRTHPEKDDRPQGASSLCCEPPKSLLGTGTGQSFSSSSDQVAAALCEDPGRFVVDASQTYGAKSEGAQEKIAELQRVPSGSLGTSPSVQMGGVLFEFLSDLSGAAQLHRVLEPQGAQQQF